MGARPCDLPKVLITDANRCRISHLAVCPRARVILNLIYGAKGDREAVDDYNLRVSQLWQDVANTFVNNQNWQPHSDVEYYDLFKDLDTSVPPAAPGLDVQTIKDTWMSIRTDWSRLFGAVFGQTGASSTAGDQLFDTAYKNFICGTRMTFTHKVVAQYVFMLWHTQFVSLPQWCNRTLAPQSMLRAGVGETENLSFTTPDKGKTNGRPASPAVPGSSVALEKLIEVFTKKMESENAVTTTDPTQKKSEQMAGIHKQLEVLYAARKIASDDEFRDEAAIQKFTSAIQKLNEKLLEECFN